MTATTEYEKLFRLDGRTAFVSGAAGHLGRPMSCALAAAGAHVILNGRTASKLEALRDELVDAGCQASVAAFDIMDRQVVDDFMKSLDRLDILINNAITGGVPGTDLFGEKAFAATLNSGVTSIYGNIMSALPAMEAAVAATGGASVINITSIYGHVAPTFSIYQDFGFRSPPQYGAAKGGLLQLTRYLACDLAPKKIRVNSLSPGIFPWDSIAETHPGFIDRVGEISPMGRPGLAPEIGGPAVFLASDASSYMTGSEVLVDGGWLAK